MYGAQSLVRTLVDSGVEVTFANPGTSEMHLVTAIDSTPGMRSVLGLFEGVVTGMADGYARVAEKPAATLLHLGPGLANGLANLHNARRASSPVVNIVGDHATHHLHLDAPLASDIVGFARPVSGWVHTATHPLTVGADAARAVQASRQWPGQIATLILPAEVAWTEGGVAAPPLEVRGPAAFDAACVAAAATAVKSGRKVGILMRGEALKERGLTAAGRVATVGNVRLMCDTFSPRIQKGAGRVAVQRLPYFAEQLVEFMADLDVLVIVGTKPPVTFFAYPGKPSLFAPEGCAIIPLALPHEDLVGALEALAETLKAPAVAVMPDAPRPAMPRGALTPETIADALCHLIPDNAIVVDESVTTGRGFFRATHGAAPHDWLALTGGAIGEGLCLSTGAAVACPDRQVIGLQADGSAMYTVQALWTHARENLKILTLIWSNRAYAILRHELMNVGANPGRKALDMLSLGNPDIDWVGMARSMGVPGSRVDSVEGLAKAVHAGLATQGPYLVEVAL